MDHNLCTACSLGPQIFNWPVVGGSAVGQVSIEAMRARLELYHRRPLPTNSPPASDSDLIVFLHAVCSESKTNSARD